MANKDDLGAIEFSVGDLGTLEQIATQLSACKQAADKAGRSANVLAVFLKMTDERMGKFVGDLKERMKVAPRAAT